MPFVQRVQVPWTGLVTGGGVSTFYFRQDENVAPPMAALRAFFESVKAGMPGSITWTYPTAGPVINPETGKLEGAWTAPVQAASTAPAAASGPLAAGAVVHWLTGAYATGRRIRGRTFLVPVQNGAWASDGTLGDSTRTMIATAAAALVAAAPSMVVWSKRNGATFDVDSASVPKKGVILTSRRD